MTCTVTTVLPFHVPSSLRGNGEICVCPLSVCVSVHMLQQVCVETEMLTYHYYIYILVHLGFLFWFMAYIMYYLHSPLYIKHSY